MSLETLYNEAQSNTYVGTVRRRQAAMAPTNQTLVNFLDGERKVRGQDGADVYQKEFTRNREGQYVTGGSQAPARPAAGLTRWTQKAFKLAFDGEGPSQLRNGFYTNQFRTAVGPGGQTIVHNYTPLNGRKFGDLNTSARTRIVSSPSGAPTGI